MAMEAIQSGTLEFPGALVGTGPEEGRPGRAQAAPLLQRTATGTGCGQGMKPGLVLQMWHCRTAVPEILERGHSGRNPRDYRAWDMLEHKPQTEQVQAEPVVLHRKAAGR